jgi:hypothetical protein
MLRRLTPLRRRLFRRRPARRSAYRRRIRDIDFMIFVKRLRCCARHLGPCLGPVEADHVGPRGLGQKSDDRFVIPLCTGHHRARTDFSGVFKNFDQAAMRSFVVQALVQTQTAAIRCGVITLPITSP